MGGIHLHDVPKNGPPTDLDHGLGTQVRLFRDAGSQAPREQYGFHARSIVQPLGHQKALPLRKDSPNAAIARARTATATTLIHQIAINTLAIGAFQ
ncbi:hypothetical protein D3C72_2316060 [compost metagenome]